MTRVWTITVAGEPVWDEAADAPAHWRAKSDAIREAKRLEHERPFADVRILPSCLQDLT